MNPQRAVKKTAKRHGVSEQYARNELQKALDAAWSTNDEAALKRQRELFPNGKPTIEEFVRKVSQMAAGS